MTYPENFFEVDFLDVETKSSGDAITIRVGNNGIQTISVVDGGYAECSEKIANHIKSHYDNASIIDHMVLTHPDGDHAGGLKGLMERFTVNRLWMNRPWLYARELLPYYPSYNSADALASRLKKKYPHVRDLEEKAIELGIPINEAFQGAVIGHFTVMTPTKEKFLRLVLRDDDKADEKAETFSEELSKIWLADALTKAFRMIASAWGAENLPDKDTTPRNEMSLVQYANIGGEKILLTADAGKEALSETISYAPLAGLALPGIDRFQVPHHGSRRNVSTELLNQLLGPIKAARSDGHFSALISSAKEDVHHPKKAVVRAMIHRGGNVATTEGIDVRTGWNAPPRQGWGPVAPAGYPSEQEE